VLRFVLSADVTVTGNRTFTNLADAEAPAEDLVGIAQSSSQGPITAKQLDARAVMRSGEVPEAVPGVIALQHSGETKAQSVLSARLQSRSRHGLRVNRRRHARQHADACAWAGLFRCQFSDS
jgi:hypothetical protein